MAAENYCNGCGRFKALAPGTHLCVICWDAWLELASVKHNQKDLGSR